MHHLTPDELAAWMDGTLSAAERSAAETHASDCAHCQAMLSAMARTAPDVARRPSWIGSVRWLVPIAAAAIVIAVWVGVTREPAPRPVATNTAEPAPVPERETKPPAVAQVPPEPSVKVEQARPLADAKEKLSKRTAARKDRDEAAQSVGGIAANKKTEDRVDALVPNAAPIVLPPPPPAPLAPPPLSAVGQAAATPSPATTPSAPPESVPAKPLTQNETVTVTSEAPLAAARSGLLGGGRLPPVEVVSPERSYRWRAVAPGSIQYSVDGGMNWRSSTTGTSVALRAGSAPSRTVCWLVGQGGLVLLTTDGQNWQVRPFPERVDLTGVSASDARTATVTTANRRRVATADGGATWSPLQEN